MALAVPAAALALLALPVIVVLHLLRARHPEVAVGSLAGWRGPVHQARARPRWRRPRPSPLLLVQLAVAALLAGALMRPGVPGPAGFAGTTVVLLDGSATMQATDVAPSRFGVAVAEARRLGRGAGPGRLVALAVLGPTSVQLSPPTRDPAVVDSALDRARPTAGVADLAEALSLADAILAGRPGGRVVLLTDGRLRQNEPPGRLRAPLEVRLIGSSAENVALEPLHRRPDGTVSVRVENLGRGAREVEVQMVADGRVVDVLPLRAEAGSGAGVFWAGLPGTTRVLEARIPAGDDFALDDRAFLLTEPGARHRVLLVTSGNGFLERALRLRGDVEVTVADPQGYRPGRHDLYVFDGFAPSGPLPGPALVVAPPQGTGPVPGGPSVDPGRILPTDPRDPLLAHVDLGAVHVAAAARMVEPPGWRTVVAAEQGPLLLVRRSEPRAAVLAFDVHDSDLPLRTAFPILVHNLLAELLPGDPGRRPVRPGEPVPLPSGPQASEVRVLAPDGTEQRLRPPLPATFTPGGPPGVYEVTESAPEGPRTNRFVLALDADASQIEPRPVAPVGAGESRPGSPVRGTVEVWPWIAAAVLAAMAAEWRMFLRR